MHTKLHSELRFTPICSDFRLGSIRFSCSDLLRCHSKTQISPPRAREGAARATLTPGAGATDESESKTTGSTSSPKFVAFGGATQPPRSSERARPSVSLLQTPHAKPFPALTAASAAPSGENSAPFSRGLRRVIRRRRETPGAGPRARQSERPDDLESPLIPQCPLRKLLPRLKPAACVF